jgi:hypothetical protein
MPHLSSIISEFISTYMLMYVIKTHKCVKKLTVFL